MPVNEKESKERHGGCNREGGMEMSGKIQLRERSREGADHSQLCHLRHLHNGGRDRASELIGVQISEHAGE